MSVVQLVEAWHRLRREGAGFYLATVVRVEGSAYRKPGARMLIAAGGRRSGTISGGCLEGEVARKAAWLTAQGPCIEVYRSEEDLEAGRYGTGCGGTVSVLLQGQAEAAPVLEAIERVVQDRLPAVVVCTLAGPGAGQSAILTDVARNPHALQSIADRHAVEAGGRVYLPILPPPHLFVFGAGDDALPLARFAVELGWQLTVADGRANLLRPERFSETAILHRIAYAAEEGTDLLSATNLQDLAIPDDAYTVLLTHSFQQDRAILAALLARPIGYIGVLGPRHRTQRLTEEVAGRLGLDAAACLARLHAPVGLPIGFDDPAAIALSIVAEIQAELEGKRVSIEPKRSL